MHSTLWSLSLCEAAVMKEGEVMREGRCRHIRIHVDTLNTTAIVDHLLPCTQYIVRWSSIY